MRAAHVFVAAAGLALCLSAPAHANMAACTSAAVKDDPADQIRLYTLCLEGQLRRSDRGAAYNNRGSVYMRTGDIDSALADFTKSIEYDPDFALAYFNRALVHAQRGDLELALADMDESLEHPPSRIRTDVYIQRANVRVTLSDEAGAAADFEEALDRDDERADAMFGLAMLRVTADDSALRDAAAALTLGERMLEEQDDDAPTPMPHVVMAAAHAELGQSADAAQQQALANQIMTQTGVMLPGMDDLPEHYAAGGTLLSFEGQSAP